MSVRLSALVIVGASLLAGCASSQSRMQPMGDLPRQSRAPNCSVEVFRTTPPTRPFTKVARLDVHREATYFLQPSFDDLLPDLKKQACLAGADAIIDIVETKGGYLETSSNHLTATAIVFQ
jgi:hypothetical protein